MEKQILISLGREFGSGGHKIAQKIARELQIPYYDKNIVEKIFGDDYLSSEEMEQYDEKLANPFLTRRVRGYTNSMEEILAKKQFDFIRAKAENGESFIIVGRCAETVLRDFDSHVSFFILADMYDKIQRVMDREGRDERDAIRRIQLMDSTRKRYHNFYSDMKWGDSRGYDICINASGLGIDATADILIDYIKKRFDLT